MREQPPPKTGRRAAGPDAAVSPGGPAPSETIETALGRALQLHQAGQLREAEQIYRRALAADSDHAAVNYYLGLIEHENGNFDASVRHLGKTLTARPDFAEGHHNLGVTLMAAGNLAGAEKSFRRALSLMPGDVETLISIGNLMVEQGRYEEALPALRKATATQPGHAEAHNSLGNVLREEGHLDDAVTSFRKALALQPDSADAHYNLGLTLGALGRNEEAAVSFRTTLQFRPADAEAAINLGDMLRGLGRRQEALEIYENLLVVRPDFPTAHMSRGNVLRDLTRHDEALESYGKAIGIDPKFAAAYSRHGSLLGALNRYEEARADFEHVLGIDPDFPYNRGDIFIAKLKSCDWDSFEEHCRSITEGVRDKSLLIEPFSFSAFSASAADQLICAQTYVDDRCPASPTPLWTGERYRHEKIRVAYVSADFHSHPMAFLMAGLFEQHDRSRFETIAISFGPRKQGEMRRRLENAFDRFIDVEDKSTGAIAQLIRDLEIDIAIDRKGYTEDARPGIFALRPAPVQAAWLAYPGTVGATYMDYILADRFVIAEDQQQYYSENVVYLPDTYQANDSKRPIAEHTPSRAEVGLPEQGFVFACFNNNYKITPQMFDIWMRLLGRVEGSVLWLLESNAAAARNLRREAERRGMAPERLVFAPRTKNEDHLARHRLADLALDTLPFNAHTTTSDALWAGLPVVTCLGTTFAGRVAGSLLNADGLPELITNSLEEYETLALELARDMDALAAVKSKLARNRLTHPLFDTDRMRRHVEAAYEAMYQRHRRGEPAAGFTVPAIGD